MVDVAHGILYAHLAEKHTFCITVDGQNIMRWLFHHKT